MYAFQISVLSGKFAENYGFMIKALFFDIDGTLISFDTHKVPASTIKAIQMAKENGVKVFISTGRPQPIICNLDQVMPYVDGFVTTNGAYCYIGEDVVYCQELCVNNVKAIVDAAVRFQVACVVVGKRHIAVVNEDDHFDAIFRKMLRISTLDALSPLEEVMAEGVIQLTPFFTQEQEEEVIGKLSGCTCGRWHPDFVDVTAAGVDKGLGLELMAKHMGLKIEETMAFGDGGNDLPIIVKAGVGVAMGNAGDELKAAADLVTTHIDDDGVYNALKKYEVI